MFHLTAVLIVGLCSDVDEWIYSSGFSSASKEGILKQDFSPMAVREDHAATDIKKYL
jgi:hypothetical protein